MRSIETDEELLRNAAKAIRLDVWIEDGPLDDGKYRAELDTEGGCASEWNPLIDDGDALRVAMKLELSVMCVMNTSAGTGYSCAELLAEDSGWTELHRNHNGDYMAATRRAIVRAAAAIGSEVVQPLVRKPGVQVVPTEDQS